ncbi:RNA splicing factor [Lithospermum erythrorhizon]|uniref:RNA splicing factor n=1 Tax=Lithospermum erythrorhizon TaxID=34254 RepID=A0AAV3RRU9_LITER
MDPYIDHDSNESKSLYVKNLNFKTSAESLKKHFSKLVKGGKILSVRVLKGFGFIEFDSVDAAVNICRDIQGTVLDGHALILQICHANKEEGKTATKVENSKSPTKLIIRNVAFEATKKELRDMFCKYGQIKSLRLPKKVDNQHMGFSFYALQQVSHTHFRGRPLVVEHAKEAECLEDLRARTKAQFSEACSGLLNSARMLKKRKKLGGFDEDHRSNLSRGESRGRQKQSIKRGKRMKRK